MLQITVKIGPFIAVQKHDAASSVYLNQRWLKEVFLQKILTQTYIQHCHFSTGKAARTAEDKPEPGKIRSKNS